MFLDAVHTMQVRLGILFKVPIIPILTLVYRMQGGEVTRTGDS